MRTCLNQVKGHFFGPTNNTFWPESIIQVLQKILLQDSPKRAHEFKITTITFNSCVYNTFAVRFSDGKAIVCGINNLLNVKE